MEDYATLERTLLNTDGSTPLAKRFQALFALRSLGTSQSIKIISKAFQDPSALLGHEVAYVLGQIGSTEALPALEKVLRDVEIHPMTRHEAAEAMGAISDLSSLSILREYRDKADEHTAVKETCEIAVQKIEYDHSLALTEKTQKSLWDSVDPAPPLSMHDTSNSTLPIPQLRSILLDPSLSLFQRYRAMFALRNYGPDSKEAVLALADGFADSSALFRHEIAYIFGQLTSVHSIPSLERVLNDTAEDEMVRHEAAEALGSIGTEEVLPVLQAWLEREDCPRVVRESCAVALDISESIDYGNFPQERDQGERPALNIPLGQVVADQSQFQMIPPYLQRLLQEKLATKLINSPTFTGAVQSTYQTLQAIQEGYKSGMQDDRPLSKDTSTSARKVSVKDQRLEAFLSQVKQDLEEQRRNEVDKKG